MDITFTLTITGMEHGEWQGRLKRADGGEQGFQSVLELLRQLNCELGNERA
ncbi:MAG: hypothetical protein LKJ80_06145 [Oscillibacter sp.]|jgi:hypothetical protein|nr:hypothetical protein [Oscillibacter sp.]